jgi:hypothetical protein
MTMQETPAPHTEIRKLLRDNFVKLPALLHGYWHRSATDFIDAGLDRATISDSLFTVAVAHQVAAIGMEETIKLLRGVADFHELHMTAEQGKLSNAEQEALHTDSKSPKSDLSSPAKSGRVVYLSALRTQAASKDQQRT